MELLWSNDQHCPMKTSTGYDIMSLAHTGYDVMSHAYTQLR